MVIYLQLSCRNSTVLAIMPHPKDVLKIEICQTAKVFSSLIFKKSNSSQISCNVFYYKFANSHYALKSNIMQQNECT